MNTTCNKRSRCEESKMDHRSPASRRLSAALSESASTVDSNSTMTSSSSSSSSKRRVKFDKITIRSYNVTVSDHPSCSSGAPIGLSWDYATDHIEVPVRDFEALRKNNRRNKCQMLIPAQIRHDMLRYEFNVPLHEIHLRTKEVYEMKKRRLQCLKQHGRRKRVGNLLDSATKPLRRLVGKTA